MEWEEKEYLRKYAMMMPIFESWQGTIRKSSDLLGVTPKGGQAVKTQNRVTGQ